MKRYTIITRLPGHNTTAIRPGNRTTYRCYLRNGLMAASGRAQAGFDSMDGDRAKKAFQRCFDVFLPGQRGA